MAGALSELILKIFFIITFFCLAIWFGAHAIFKTKKTVSLCVVVDIILFFYSSIIFSSILHANFKCGFGSLLWESLNLGANYFTLPFLILFLVLLIIVLFKLNIWILSSSRKYKVFIIFSTIIFSALSSQVIFSPTLQGPILKYYINSEKFEKELLEYTKKNHITSCQNYIFQKIHNDSDKKYAERIALNLRSNDPQISRGAAHWLVRITCFDRFDNLRSALKDNALEIYSIYLLINTLNEADASIRSNVIEALEMKRLDVHFGEDSAKWSEWLGRNKEILMKSTPNPDRCW